MKKNSSKRDFGKFVKVNTHKRRAKDAARRELERAVAETNVKASNVAFSSVDDLGRRLDRMNLGKEIRQEGIYSSTKSGFGFVRLEDSVDVFIPAGRHGGALDGDLVLISYHKYKNRFGEEKTEGRVEKIIEYGRKTLIGDLVEELVLIGRRRRGWVLLLVPDDPKISIRPRIEETMGAPVGHKVEVKLHRAPYGIVADVIRDFGDAESFGAGYLAHLAEHGIETEFSQAALEEASSVSRMPVTAEGRSDKRDKVIFTIDGDGAKDLDDAVSVRKLAGGGWSLGVHIADVSHYVREKTALDRAAMSRGTSVYFTDKVVPMLPEAISNGSCSLNAGEDKYALSATVRISEEGELLGVKIEPSVINSRVRGVYSEVNAIFDGTANSETKKKYKPVMQSLARMRELYLVLKEKSHKRGSVELEFAEAEVKLDPLGEPTEIAKRERGDAEMMIEQFMLAANEAVARYLTDAGIPCVYRIHEPPPEDKLVQLLTYLKNLGFDLSGLSTGKLAPSDLTRFLTEAKDRDLFAPVSYTVLRSMSKARYSDERQAHFGLGLSHYCHFTSPIRRLADLATHRVIHRVLFEGRPCGQYAQYARRAAVAASEAELRALGAERDIENMYKALYMSRFLGDVFYAVVSSVTSFGLFCELENTCEGLVPISELSGVFTFDEKTLTLRSKYESFRLADRLKVRLEEVDVMRGKLRFSIVGRMDA